MRALTLSPSTIATARDIIHRHPVGRDEARGGVGLDSPGFVNAHILRQRFDQHKVRPAQGSASNADQSTTRHGGARGPPRLFYRQSPPAPLRPGRTCQLAGEGTGPVVVDRSGAGDPASLP